MPENTSGNESPPRMTNYCESLEQASGGNSARITELEAKHASLRHWLVEHAYEGIVIRRHENLAWITAGQLLARVGIASETGIVALLHLRDGRRFAIAPNNESARLADDELPSLGYELIVCPWHALDFAREAQNIGGPALASDSVLGALPVVNLATLRAPLHASEVARYRVLARDTADVVAETLLALEPGASEYEMEAWTAERLLRRGIFPSVLLMATDDRILKYKHAVARGNRLERFGMLNLCTRRWGLVVSITRFVHFGAMAAELAQGFATAAVANSALQHATRQGASAGALFQAAAHAYAQAGFPGEEQLHHQGGATGYLEREWVATPEGTQTVQSPQAYAWNPTSRGGKVEDTTLLCNEAIELLTATPSLPTALTECGGSTYTSAGVLLRT